MWSLEGVMVEMLVAFRKSTLTNFLCSKLSIATSTSITTLCAGGITTVLLLFPFLCRSVFAFFRFSSSPNGDCHHRHHKTTAGHYQSYDSSISRVCSPYPTHQSLLQTSVHVRIQRSRTYLWPKGNPHNGSIDAPLPLWGELSL